MIIRIENKPLYQMDIYICKKCVTKYYGDYENDFEESDGEEASCEICYTVAPMYFHYFCELEVLEMVRTIRLQKEEIKKLEKELHIKFVPECEGKKESFYSLMFEALKTYTKKNDISD